DPGQAQIVVEHLHPHGVGTTAKPEKELLFHRLLCSIFVRDRFQKVAPVLVELVLVRIGARLSVGVHDPVATNSRCTGRGVAWMTTLVTISDTNKQASSA